MVIAIIGFIRLNQVSNNSNDIVQEIEEQTKNIQINNNKNINKEININLYEESSIKPTNIVFDDTSETGAIYTFSKEDLKLAIENACKENNVKYEESSSNSQEHYGFIIDLNNSKILEISITMQNDKIIGMSISRLLLEKRYTNEIENKIFTNIIKNLFEEEYAEQIIKAKNELRDSEYRIANNTVYMKIDYNTIMSSQLEADEWNLVKEQMDTMNIDTNIQIFMFMPASQENCNEIKEDTTFGKIELSENTQGTMFKHIESISYIKFTSNTEFEMMLGQEGSEEYIKNGTYIRNGNEIILNVTYDRELEHIGIPKSYKTKIKIIDSNTLQYEYGENADTYIFKNDNI